MSYELREARVGDFESLSSLAAASADTGRIRVALEYLRDPVEAWAALKPELRCVVAEAADGALIGSAQMITTEVEVEDELHTCAILGSLMVHPAHRRRGVASALTRWRLDRAGSDAVIAAGIQIGNEGSFANARKWATQIFGSLILPAFSVLRASSWPDGALEIREPSNEAEWDEAAAGRAAFEQGWNLRSPRTGAALRERAGRMLGGERLQRYFVAVELGRVVGGFELFEGSRIEALVFEDVPLPLRAINLFLRVLPRDGVVHPVTLSGLWYASDRADVGRALWGRARALAAESGNAIGTQLDPRGPLAPLVQLRPWTPKGQLSLAIRSPVRLSEERLLAAP